jgi:hypothetical protein
MTRDRNGRNHGQRGRFTAERVTETITERVTERITVEDTTPPGGEWARLTAPLDTAPPVILTPAMRAATSSYRDRLRAGRAADRAMTGKWYVEASGRTFDPLDAWLATGRST